GGFHTILTTVSFISGISASTPLTSVSICPANGHPIEVSVIVTVHTPSSSRSTSYTSPIFTISIPNSGSITFSSAPIRFSFNASSTIIPPFYFYLYLIIFINIFELINFIIINVFDTSLQHLPLITYLDDAFDFLHVNKLNHHQNYNFQLFFYKIHL